MSSLPFITIIIPTKNGESTIFNCLNSIEKQSYKNFEVIVIDSGSEDETLTIARTFSFVRVIEIPANTFNHGLTRNLGVKEAKGEFVIFTVQDAYASKDNWIEIMLSHFIEDAEVVGVCGQQVVPHKNEMNPHEWYRPVNTPSVKSVWLKNIEDISKISASELRKMCGWDNVNSMYRKSVFSNFPFRKTDFAEDLQWAKEVILAGRKLIYDANSSVFHYHHNTSDYIYRKTFTIFYHSYLIFGDLRSINYSWLDYLLVVYRNFKYQVPLHWILFNWKAMYAKEKASSDIRIRLKEGFEKLKQYHYSICSTPPQGKQNE